MTPARDSAIWRMASSPAPALATVLLLAGGFAAMRVAGMLGPPSLRWLLPLVFMLMALMPWLLMNADGRADLRGAVGLTFRTSG